MSRVYGDPLDISPPKRLPRWMVIPDYLGQPQLSLSQECQDPPAMSTPTSISPAGSTPTPSSMLQTSTDASYYGPMYTFDLDSTSLSDNEDLSL